MTRQLPEGYLIVAKPSAISGTTWYHLMFNGTAVASEMVAARSDRYYIRKLERLARLRAKHQVKELGR